MAGSSGARGVSLAKVREAVKRIVLHHFGAKAKSIERQHGGATNLVFAVQLSRAEYIVRLNPNPARLDSFRKEQWASARARRAGVPVPDILEPGSEPFPYMIQTKSDGQPAASHSERLRIVKDLGRYAARINSIRTHGFGATFDWSPNQRSSHADWSEFLANELHLERRLNSLRRQRMISPERMNRIRTALESAFGKGSKPALNHGDLRLKNVLVNDRGRIVAILDWENCTSNLAPEWELSLALHDRSIDEKDAFLRGYGVRPNGLCAMAPVLKALNLVNYAPEIERLVRKKDKDELERYRARLSGALDLYSI